MTSYEFLLMSDDLGKEIMNHELAKDQFCVLSDEGRKGNGAG
jgi:hypothetical protein